MLVPATKINSTAKMLAMEEVVSGKSYGKIYILCIVALLYRLQLPVYRVSAITLVTLFFAISQLPEHRG